VLARIHAFSAARPQLAAQFDSDAIFVDIRLEPYLLAAAGAPRRLAPALERLVEVTRSTRLALVHGDVSPKNILLGPTARCCSTPSAPGGATRPSTSPSASITSSSSACGPRPRRAAFSPASTARRGLPRGVDWEPPQAVEGRAAALLPGLLLARVDGKSPVEYIADDPSRDTVRRVARSLLRTPVQRLSEVKAAWHGELRA
jgi:hypothetical protein